MGEERTGGAQEGGQYVTVGEAAKLLGVHRNTVHNRIKAGRIKAHKVVEHEKQFYRIDRESLGVVRPGANVRNLDAQRTTEGQELIKAIVDRLDTVVRDHAQEVGAVREQLGEERARRQQAEEEAERLRMLLARRSWWRRFFGFSE